MPTTRPTLNVAFDEGTLARLRQFCVEEGVSASGLLEAFARTAVGGRPSWLRGLVTRARIIDGERRSRR